MLFSATLFAVEDANIKHSKPWNGFQCNEDLSGAFRATYKASGPTFTFLILAGLNCTERLLEMVNKNSVFNTVHAILYQYIFFCLSFFQLCYINNTTQIISTKIKN